MEEEGKTKQSFCSTTKCSAILALMVVVAIAIVCVVSFVDKDVREKVQYDPSDLEWWKKTIIYQIYPRSFQDSDGDGTGDLKGITQRLDHFTYLNIGALWISPFYESPMRDFGYDVKNFTNIDPIFGNMSDFEELMEEAKKRGIKVIMDFVPNHSSNDSIWFQKSRTLDPDYRDYYIWDDGKAINRTFNAPPNNWKSVFGGSAWKFDELRGQYYYHAFLDSQPDLNYRNKKVREEILNAMRFWIEKGVAGFRLDAMKMLYESENRTINDPDYENYTLFDDSAPYKYTTNLPETYGTIKEWRKLLDEIEAKDKLPRIMIQESYGFSKTIVSEYYKAGSVPFNFALISKLNKTCGGRCIKDIVNASVNGLPDKAWPNFVMGNHDNHRVADRLGREMVNAMNMLLLTLPGTPTTYMGEEIGMEDTNYNYTELQDPYGKNHPNEFKKVGRDPERSPMQWNSTENAGFTTGAPWLRINSNYSKLNVQLQMDDEGMSPIKIYKKLAEIRQLPSFENGDIKIGVTNANIFSYVRTAEGRPKYLIIINFGFESTEDFSKEPVSSSKGEIVITTNNFSSDRFKIGKTLDLTSISLKRGQGLVIHVDHK